MHFTCTGFAEPVHVTGMQKVTIFFGLSDYVPINIYSTQFLCTYKKEKNQEECCYTHPAATMIIMYSQSL